MAERTEVDVVQRIISTFDPKGQAQAIAGTKAFEDASARSAAKAAADAKKIELAHQAAARNVTRGYLDMVSAIDPRLEALSGAGHKAANALGDIQKTGGALGGVLGLAVVGGALAAAGAVAEFARRGVEDFTHLADQVRKVQLTMGGTAEAASRLVEAGNAVGVSSDTIANASFRLSQRIAAGAKGFDEYGIAVARTRTGAVDLRTTLGNVADAFNKAEDPALRDKIAFQAFGRSGAELVPILARGSAGLRELEAEAKNILSADDLKKAKDYELAMKALEEQNKKLAISVGSFVTPALTNLSVALRGALGGSTEAERAAVRNTDASSKWGSALKFLAGGVVGEFSAVQDLGHAMNSANAAQSSLTGATVAAQGAILATAQAEKERTITLDNEAKAQLGLVDAELRAADSLATVAQGTDNIARAEENLAKARAGRGQGGVKSAQKTLEQAQDALRKAEEAQHSPRAAAGAALAQERAQRQIEQATDAAGKAQSNLTKLQRLGAQGSEVYAQALEAQQTTQENVKVSQEALAQTRLSADDAAVAAADRVKQAQEQVTNAQEGLTAAQEAAKPQADAIRSAQDALSSAYRSQEGNINAAAHATQALKETQAKARGETYTAKQAVDDYAAALESLGGKSSALDGLVSKFRDLRAAAEAAAAPLAAPSRGADLRARTTGGEAQYQYNNNLNPFQVDQLRTLLFAPPIARAEGGPVVPGRVYTVGERGPEPIVFDNPGTVFPTGTQVGGEVQQHFHIGQVKDDLTIRQLSRELAWQAKTQR